MTAAALDDDRTLIDWITVTHDVRPRLAPRLRDTAESQMSRPGPPRPVR